MWRLAAIKICILGEIRGHVLKSTRTSLSSIKFPTQKINNYLRCELFSGPPIFSDLSPPPTTPVSCLCRPSLNLSSSFHSLVHLLSIDWELDWGPRLECWRLDTLHCLVASRLAQYPGRLLSFNLLFFSSNTFYLVLLMFVHLGGVLFSTTCKKRRIISAKESLVYVWDSYNRYQKNLTAQLVDRLEALMFAFGKMTSLRKILFPFST
jgi:hypothetical protein